MSYLCFFFLLFLFPLRGLFPFFASAFVLVSVSVSWFALDLCFAIYLRIAVCPRFVLVLVSAIFFLLLYLSRFALSAFCGRVGDVPLPPATFTSAPSVPALLGTVLFISGFLSDFRFRFPMKLSRYMAVFHARSHFIFSVLFAAFYAACFPAYICCR